MGKQIGESDTQGQNNNPIEEYLEGMPPSNVKNNPELVRVLKEKNASYSDLNHNRMEKRAQRLEDTGQFRIMESAGRKFTRGFKPKFGEVRKVRDIQGPLVTDDQNKDHLTKFVLPVSETTEDEGPRRIEQKGNAIVDSTRRARLRPFAEKLVELLRRRRGAVTAATASKFLGEQRGFREAMA